MSAAGYLLLLVAGVLGGVVIWSYMVDASYKRHPPNPRYCHERHCLRLSGHPGSHVDSSGRTWL